MPSFVARIRPARFVIRVWSPRAGSRRDRRRDNHAPFGVITFLFGMIFKLLPDVYVAWRDVWLSAALIALVFAWPDHNRGTVPAEAAAPGAEEAKAEAGRIGQPPFQVTRGP